MNKKFLTYILLAVVIGIWGKIIYTSFFEGFEDEFIPEIQVAKEITKQEERQVEQIELIADYRDPFLGSRTRPISGNKPFVSTRKKTNQKEKLKVQEQVVWPEINYFGLVKNQSSSDKIAIVKIKKKQVLLKEGQEFEDLSMLKIYKDSILLSMSNESKTFLKN